MLTYLKQIQERLKAVYENELMCNQYAWWLLEKLTERSKVELLSQPITLDQAQTEQLETWLDEITILHKPISYILGNVPFGPLSIIVRPPVLIPRPETEEWVLAVIEKIKQCTGEPLRILDLCTGSGCIGLLCAYLLPNAQVYAVDLYDDALALAAENKKTLGVTNLTIIKSDLFTELKEMNFDLILSNPPYITPDEYAQLEPSVARWEDEQALMTQDHGLAIIKQIIDQAPAYIKPNTCLARCNINQLFIEIGYKQAKDVSKLMQKKGYVAITITKDSAEKERVVSGSMCDVASTSDTQ